MPLYSRYRRRRSIVAQQPGFIGYWDLREGVTVVDGGVQSIQSRSRGNAQYRAEALHADHRPIYLPSDPDFGGRPSMVFDGDQWLDLSAIAAELSSSGSAMPAVTWYFLIKLSTTDTLKQIHYLSQSAGTRSGEFRTAANVRMLLVSDSDGALGQLTETPDNSIDLDPAVWTARVGGARTIRKDGTELVSEAETATGPCTIERVTIGARRSASNPIAFDRGLEAHIAAFACFAAEHDTGPMEATEPNL